MKCSHYLDCVMYASKGKSLNDFHSFDDKNLFFSDHDSFLVLQVKQPTESWN